MSDYINDHREYLLKFMQNRNLNANSWAKMADISEGTLRAYITGRSHNISLEILHKLAKAVSVSVLDLIENSANAINEENFYKAVAEIDKLLEAKGSYSSSLYRAKLYLSWYSVLNAVDKQSDTDATLKVLARMIDISFDSTSLLEKKVK